MDQAYSLIPESRMSTALKKTLSKPLSLVDREFGPMELRVALTTLVGSAYSLEEDPVNRMLNFHLKSTYKKFVR